MRDVDKNIRVDSCSVKGLITAWINKLQSETSHKFVGEDEMNMEKIERQHSGSSTQREQHSMQQQLTRQAAQKRKEERKEDETEEEEKGVGEKRKKEERESWMGRKKEEEEERKKELRERKGKTKRLIRS